VLFSLEIKPHDLFVSSTNAVAGLQCREPARLPYSGPTSLKIRCQG
jgi:hypothetical protein